MNKRLVALAAVVALAVAACGGSADSTTTSNAPETTTTAPAVEAVLLSYSLESGTQLSYEVSLDQHIDLTTSGDPSVMGDEQIPGNASVEITGTANLTHEISDGPEPGTYQVHITGDFTDVTVTGTIDGEPVEGDQAPDFASLDPVDVTIVVDEQGNIIPEDTGTADPLGGMFGDFSSLQSAPAPGLDPGQFFGPSLSDEEVAVGDTWSEDIETPGMGDEPIVTSVTSTVTGTDQIDGHDVLVIESNSTTSLIQFDLGEFFAGLFGAFMPEDTTDEEAATFQALVDQLKFLITVDGAKSETTSMFDPEAGLVRKSDLTAGANIGMDIMIPDENTSELVGFQMSMTMDQNVSYRLLSEPSA
ncbi:MAG: hypothetical protein WB245_05620 [Acidimicrobiia bacterium]